MVPASDKINLVLSKFVPRTSNLSSCKPCVVLVSSV